FEYKRRDGIFRLFAAAREDGLGPRVDLAFVTTTVSADTAALGRSLSQGALALGSSWGHGHVRVTFRSQDEDRPWQVEGSAAWIPLRPLTLAADARRARCPLRPPTGRLVFRSLRGGRQRLRAAVSRPRLRHLLLQVLARLQERDLRAPRRDRDGVVEPRDRRPRHQRERAGAFWGHVH